MKTRRRFGTVRAVLGLAFLLGATAAFAQGTQGAAQPAQSAPPAQAAPPEQKIYKNEQLDQMLAPIALYPDSLLAQLLMATTYPGDFAEAAGWVKAHPDAKGDDAVKQVDGEQWDPSVKSLVAFPQVLAQFGPQVDWVQKVGDAFLAQPEDVMASVQRLRAQAQKAGTLKTNEQQKVIVEQAPAEATAPNTTVIQIEPANPQVVYVPTYNPTVVYGSWAYPSYPPYYYPPPPYYYHPVASGLAAGIAFGVGIAAVNSLWGGCNWGRGDVNINVNRYNNVNVNNRISGSGNTNWNHNAANRRGTPYADNRSRQNYGQGVGGANNRSAYRGNADASRQRAQQSFNKSTGYAGGNRAGGTGTAGAGNRASGGGAAASNRAGGSGAAASNRAGGGAAATNRAGGSGGASRNYAGGGPGGGDRASSGSRSNAFSGASSPQSSQRQASRGQSSQRSASSGASRGGGHQVSRSAPSRGGGGGGRRR